jgi:hypothetical protein
MSASILRDLEARFATPPWSLHECRRSAVRRGVVLPCQAVREQDFKLVADRTVDISVDGMLLPLRSPARVGESLFISFGIDGFWIDTEATVARVVQGRRPSDDGPQIGVLFDPLPPSSRAALAAFLHGRRMPIPRHRGLPFPLADEKDIVDDDSDNIDGLSVLRAVVGAWQSLST